MEPVTRVLVVHQSGSLYGSDRSLLDWLEQSRHDGFEAIVCTPEAGPFVDAVRRLGVEVHVTPVFKVSRAALSDPRFILTSPARLFRSLRAIDRILKGRPVAIVYSNTIVVYVGAIWARLHGRPHVWHLREAAYRPAFVATAMRKVVALLSSRAICNSTFTQNWLLEACTVPSAVVWNGVSAVSEQDLSEARRTAARLGLGIETDECLIALPGRLSYAKGQDLLIAAVNALPADSPKFKVLIIGDELGGDSRFRADLIEAAQTGSFGDRISIVGFREDLAPVYLSADIVVMPSRQPESFGRVAIEAMAYGCTVIAAAHGGALETIEDAVSGVLVQPDSVVELTRALRRLLQDPDERVALAMRALRSQRERFSVESYRTGVSVQLRAVLSAGE
jgi:glycosyltransferase involved in cell wall biosynthesis